MSALSPLSASSLTLSRRQLLAAATALGGLGAITGCSGGGSGSGDPNAFDFWSFTGINQKDDVEKYTADNPDITVNLTEVGSTTETAQALTTALAGGKVPDLVLIQAADMPKFIQNPGNFVDLNTVGGDAMKGDYLDWVIAQATGADGELVGIPTDVGGLAVAYRTDLFAAAGLPTDREEVGALWPTWDDFTAVGQDYVAATGQPFVDNINTSYFYQLLGQVDQQFYDEEGNTVYDTNPQVRAAFDTSLKAIEANISARLESFSEGWSAGMGRGAFAAIAAPSWMLGSIRTNAPDTEGMWDVAVIPEGAGNWGGSYLAVPAGARNPDAAWNYIADRQSVAAQLEHFVDSGSLPTTPANYDDPKLLENTDPFFSGAPTGQIFTQAVLGLKPFPVGQYSAEIGTEMQNAIKGVENNGASPDEAWDVAMASVENAIGA